ncbi:radical SAM protein, partial [Candidatus Gottesmanbacteria bacterium]|nr:radical SAM protein [Candidatus Gottesmanbacteria bacterium]
MFQKYFIKTFGCAQNEADSQRLAAMLEGRGMEKAESLNDAHHVIINTCMVREMAENRVYGAVNNLAKKKIKTGMPEKIILTGCMVGMAVRDKSGKFLKLIKKRLPDVDEFLPIEEVGFDHAPLRTNRIHAWVPISNGCNNFCTFCVVPFTRGREISRPYEEILEECRQLAKKGYKKITLLGMNVNSYGADL